MDLGTIKTKLDQGKYSGSGAADKFAADVRLVWTNAMTYNRPGSEIYTTADKLAKLFERKFGKLKKDGATPTAAQGAGAAQSSSSSSKPSQPPTKQRRTEGATSARGGGGEVTREDRVKFSVMVAQLSGDELGQLVDIIQKESPDALNEEDEKEIEIEINNIDAATLLMLNEFAVKCIEKKAAAAAGAGSSGAAATTAGGVGGASSSKKK